MEFRSQVFSLSALVRKTVVRAFDPLGFRRSGDLADNSSGDLEQSALPGSGGEALRPAVNYERMLWVFLAIWFAAGIVQAIFTNLDGEEAYYATFARNLAWGYFDHPPAVAFFARIGMAIFPGDLGPRFMMVVLSTASIWIGSRLLLGKHIPVYIVTVCGLAMTQAGSMFVKTDVPLLFFATLFFYFFRRYLVSPDRVSIAVLPIAIAGMLLSKYHGILVVGLTVLCNPGLLKRGSFWLIALVSFVLVLPHGIWLYANDFVTIRYHLGGRTDGGFSWMNVAGYVLGQPLVFGPAVGFLLLPAALIAKPRSAFESTLKFNLIGVLAFFFVASFGVRIHMHWTSIGLIPVLTLGIPYLYDRLLLRKILVVLAVGTAIVLAFVRLYLAWDFLPRFIDRKLEVTHGWALWAQDVRHLADGRCVVFLNDYESAGKYTYYTGEMSHSYNSFWYENTQHDIWPIEETFRGKRAMITCVGALDQFKTTRARNGVPIAYRFVDDLQTFSKVEIRQAGASPIHCVAGVDCDVPIVLENHSAGPIVFEKNTELAPVIMYFIYDGAKAVCFGNCDVIGGLTLRDELKATIRVKPPGIAGNYKLRLTIRPGWLPPTNNGGMIGVSVTRSPLG